MDVQFAKCCNPMPGHADASATPRKMPGITIHRADCPNFARHQARSRPHHQARPGKAKGHLRDWHPRHDRANAPTCSPTSPNAIRPMNIDITRAQFHPGENGQEPFRVRVRSRDQTRVDQMTRRVAASVDTVPAIVEVQSVPTSAVSLTERYRDPSMPAFRGRHGRVQT